MKLDSYTYNYKGKDLHLKYFADHSIKDWSFDDFKLFFSTINSQPKSDKILKKNYIQCLNTIKKNKKTPLNIINYINILLEKLSEEKNSTTNYNQCAFGDGSLQVNIKNNNVHTSPSKKRSFKEAIDDNDNDDDNNVSENNNIEEDSEDIYDNDEIKTVEDDNNNDDLVWNSIESHKNRKCTYQYLNEDFHDSCIYSTDHSWMINDINISQFLMDFRKTSILGAKHMKDISDNRVLSLSFVFPFFLNQKLSCTHRTSSNLHLLIINSLDIKKCMSPIFNEAKTWCNDLDEILMKSVSTTRSISATIALEMKRYLNKIMYNMNDDDVDENKTMMLDLFFNLIMKFQNWSDCFLESTFIYQHIMPFMEHVFNAEGKLVARVGESIITGHGYNKGGADMMADYTLSYEYDHHHYLDIFVMEVKPPKKSSNSQLQSDYIKLGKEMKMMIDALSNKNIGDKVVCGLLVEGFVCTSFCMDLKYDGIYRMVELGKFYLLREPLDLVLVPRIVQYLLQIKSILLNTVKSITNNYVANSQNSNNNNNNNKSWTRPSCSTPHRIQ